MLFPLLDEDNYISFPVITILLILANALVYFYSVFTGQFEKFIITYGVIPANIAQGKELYTLVTSLFIHGGFLHLLSNMWFLWIFGDNIEYHLGKIRFILFYLVSGVIGSAVFILGTSAGPESLIPLVGASGAISGILGAYIVLHPRGGIHSVIFLGFFIHVMRIPAVLFIGLWFFMQILFFGDMSSAVAYLAHIGGFIAGLGMILVLQGKLHRVYL